MLMGNDARAQFLAWMRRHAPAAYRRVAQRAPQLLRPTASARLGADEAPAGSGGWFDKVLAIGTGALSLVQQQQVFRAQLARAKQGLPPLSTEQIQATLPAIRTEVGITPTTRKMFWVFGLGALLLVGGALVVMRK